jgi:hypothetical protein
MQGPVLARRADRTEDGTRALTRGSYLPQRFRLSPSSHFALGNYSVRRAMAPLEA